MDQPLPDAISLSDFLTWESRQSERYEWIDGTVVKLAGVSDEHAAISANLTAIIRPTLAADGPCFVRGSDRKLVPHDERGTALGSFYADIFVSCSLEDRKGSAARFPTLVIEILSEHGGGEFTKKRDAYMASEKIQEYVIVDSTRQYAIRYSWNARRFSVDEYYRGPLLLASLGRSLTFSDIYAGANVPNDPPPVASAVTSTDRTSLDGVHSAPRAFHLEARTDEQPFRFNARDARTPIASSPSAGTAYRLGLAPRTRRCAARERLY